MGRSRRKLNERFSKSSTTHSHCLKMHSFEAMMLDYIRVCIPNNRDSRIIWVWMGLGNCVIPSIDTIAKNNELSVENTNRIIKECQAKLSEPDKLDMLKVFWGRVESSIGSHNGIMRVSCLMEEITIQFAWSKPPHHKQFLSFITINPIFSIDTNADVIVRRDFDCIDCTRLNCWISQTFKREVSMPIARLHHILWSRCRSGCVLNRNDPKQWPIEFIEYMITKSHDLILKNVLVYKRTAFDKRDVKGKARQKILGIRKSPDILEQILQESAKRNNLTD